MLSESLHVGSTQSRTGYHFILGSTDDGIDVTGHRLGSSEIAEAVSAYRTIVEVAVVGVEVPLKRLRGLACLQLFHPAEHCLAEVKGHNVTPGLGELAALVGSSWPYDPKAGVLKRLSCVHLSHGRLRQGTCEKGRVVAKAQREPGRTGGARGSLFFVAHPHPTRAKLQPVPSRLIVLVARGTEW
jgi:acyl-CoA synthetase (AMP-forming)/AMP-acid ligase II